VTDHKPFIGLFSKFREDKQISLMAASRIQRWALTLAADEYHIVYKEGRNHRKNRLPLKSKETDIPMPLDTAMILNHIDERPVTYRDIYEGLCFVNGASVHSKRLARQKCPKEYHRPYFERQNELSGHNGCIPWRNRVMDASPCKISIVQELHEGHPGITRMKILASSYVWWPNRNARIVKSI
jgi:hypothetical protein